jgi:2-polyprenyl-3-methyl-5-hydroxy-6-metoxy-1,4-benzoquinol methylase
VNNFDSRAREWDSNPVFVERGETIAAAIRAVVPLNRSMRALDYGSGTGLLSFPLHEALGHITLKDSSAGMLAVAQEKISAQGVTNMTVRQADLTAEPLPQERYDIIVSAMTLHHIPDTRGILDVFRDLLAHDGWLCIADLDQEDGSFHGTEVQVHHGFDRAALATLAAEAGFGEVRFETVFEITKEGAVGSRCYPVFLMVARRGG